RVRASLSEAPGTHDLIEHSRDRWNDKLARGASFVDPEFRLQTEKALLEHFIVSPGSASSMRFSRNADGSISVFNQRIYRPFSGPVKPLWDGESPVLSKEFARKQLSTGAVDALQNSYSSVTAPGFKQRLQKLGIDGERFDSMVQRLEWLLEHRRFADTSQ